MITRKSRQSLERLYQQGYRAGNDGVDLASWMLVCHKTVSQMAYVAGWAIGQRMREANGGMTDLESFRINRPNQGYGS